MAVLTNPPRLGILDKYPAVPKPITVEPSCVARYDVLTKLARFAVEIWPAKFAVDTKFAKFAVLTTEVQTIVERYPAVPKPITVEPSCVARYEVLTKFARLAVEIWPARFAVDTKFARLAVETRPPILGILDRYPTVPRPMTVEVS